MLQIAYKSYPFLLDKMQFPEDVIIYTQFTKRAKIND